MYEQIREDTLYIMLYAVVTATALIASCYLLFRQGNAFARDVTRHCACNAQRKTAIQQKGSQSLRTLILHYKSKALFK